MKLKSITLLLVALLSISLLVGCSPKEVEQKLDAMEDSVEQQIDQVETKVDNAVTPTQQSGYTPKISVAEAEATALAHAGFAADQVTGLRTELELDDRVPHYDVQFRQDYWEYEYEINADTGEIISFEKDD